MIENSTQIRPLRLEDYGTLVRFYGKKETDWSKDSFRRCFFDDTPLAKNFTFVAMRQDEANILGTATLTFYPETVELTYGLERAKAHLQTPDFNSARAVLGGVKVAPEWRRNGIGKQLICVTLEQAALMQVPKCHLVVVPTNPAVKIYANLGFEETWEQFQYLDTNPPSPTLWCMKISIERYLATK